MDRGAVVANAAFLAPRACFKVLDPLLEAAADRLSEAADALLAGELEIARERLRAAEIPELWTHANDLMARRHADLVRYREVAGVPAKLAKAARHGVRAPNAALKMQVFRRDGFRCRYCGCRGVLSDARRIMSEMVPGAVQWGSKNTDQHAAFYALTAVADHVVPHSRGGTSDEDNLVTTCQGCNYDKEDDLIEHLGLLDPRDRLPVCDDWDGLRRMLAAQAASPVARKGRARAVADGKAAVQAVRGTARAKAPAGWYAGIERSYARQAERLLAYLPGVAHLNVNWRVNKCLLVYVTVGEAELAVLGIEPDGTVQIPWAIGDEKARFKRFATVLANGIPGAEVYETPRTWSVKKGARKVMLGELMDASEALMAAFEALRLPLDTY